MDCRQVGHFKQMHHVPTSKLLLYVQVVPFNWNLNKNFSIDGGDRTKSMLMYVLHTGSISSVVIHTLEILNKPQKINASNSSVFILYVHVLKTLETMH
jgi:hypothetical protein